MKLKQLNENMLKRLWNKVKNFNYEDNLEGRYLYLGKEKDGLPTYVVKVLKADKANDEITYENIDTGKRKTTTWELFNPSGWTGLAWIGETEEGALMAYRFWQRVMKGGSDFFVTLPAGGLYRDEDAAGRSMNRAKRELKIAVSVKRNKRLAKENYTSPVGTKIVNGEDKGDVIFHVFDIKEIRG